MYKKQKDDDLIERFRGLLDEYNIGKDKDEQITSIKLSDSQDKAIELFNRGHNIFIIGEGGTGKSKLIREMKYQTDKNWPNKKIIITATTGIAAYNINGITINSFMGIGTGEQTTEVLVKRIRRNIGIRERIKNTDILVIDEISMASAELFEKINTICQIIRRNHLLFGGIQIVLTGDLLQLLPVFNRNNVLFPDQDKRLIFESDIFKRSFNNKNIIQLITNFRQNDPVFRNILSRIRRGQQTVEDIAILQTRSIKNRDVATIETENMVHLVSSNKRAQIINMSNINSLSDTGIIYKSQFIQNGERSISDELKRELFNQFEQRGVNEINLKKNARVMLIKNLDVEEGLVNGSVGTIIHFDDVDGQKFPVVKFDNGVEKLISPVEWKIELNNSDVTGIQLPLMLCWAITIHKSQSLTLDNAILELDDCFCEAQIYVALSRLRNLQGLIIKSFNPKKIMVNQKVLHYLSAIEK